MEKVLVTIQLRLKPLLTEWEADEAWVGNITLQESWSKIICPSYVCSFSPSPRR